MYKSWQKFRGCITSMKDEAIDANLLISMDTYLLYKTLLISKGAKCGKQPAIAVSPLTNVVGSSTAFEKLWFFENIGDSLDRSWSEANIFVVFGGGRGREHP